MTWGQHQNKGLKDRSAESLDSERDGNLPRSYSLNSHLQQSQAATNTFSVDGQILDSIVEITQDSDQEMAPITPKANTTEARSEPIEASEVNEDSNLSELSDLSHLSELSGLPQLSELLEMAQPSAASGDPEEPVTGVAALYVDDNIDDTDPFYETEFQAETDAVLAYSNDYRFVTPNARRTAKRDRAYIRRALQLTAIDFCDRRGHALPQEFLTEYTNESYISQQRRIQKEFNRVWSGMLPAPNLYCLPAWHTEFRSWKVSAGKGQQCMNKLLAAEKLSKTLARHST